MKSPVKKIINKSLRYLSRIKSRLYVLTYSFLCGSFPLTTRTYGEFNYVGDLSNLYLGNNVTINHGVYFNLSAPISIGENTHLSTMVQIHTGKLNYSRTRHISKPIYIGRSCWIASGVVISSGVALGDNIIVGANSVVLNDLVQPGLYVGTPARFIKSINVMM